MELFTYQLKFFRKIHNSRKNMACFVDVSLLVFSLHCLLTILYSADIMWSILIMIWLTFLNWQIMRVGSEKLRNSHKIDEELMTCLIYNQEFFSYPRIFQMFPNGKKVEGHTSKEYRCMIWITLTWIWIFNSYLY